MGDHSVVVSVIVCVCGDVCVCVCVCSRVRVCGRVLKDPWTVSFFPAVSHWTAPFVGRCKLTQRATAIDCSYRISRSWVLHEYSYYWVIQEKGARPVFTF